MSRDFGTFNALKDVNLTVRRGEFIALLGPSGCGKSTALNCLAGLLPLTGGSIWLDERRIDQLQPEERGFGMVFQNYALFPHMSVRKNVGFGLAMQRPCRRPRSTRRVDEALALVRLERSGRQAAGPALGRPAAARRDRARHRHRAAAGADGRAAVEPRRQAAARDARRDPPHPRTLGSTTIYVTHDQEEALSLADRIVVMRDGEVRQVGTPEELYVRPAHLDVAEFMGFRNQIRSRATKAGNLLSISIGGVGLQGTPIDGAEDATSSLLSVPTI